MASSSLPLAGDHPGCLSPTKPKSSAERRQGVWRTIRAASHARPRQANQRHLNQRLTDLHVALIAHCQPSSITSRWQRSNYKECPFDDPALGPLAPPANPRRACDRVKLPAARRLAPLCQFESLVGMVYPDGACGHWHMCGVIAMYTA